MDWLSGSKSGTWYLYGPGNSVLASQNLGYSFTADLVATGQYYLVLAGSDETLGDYQFKVSAGVDVPVTNTGLNQVYEGVIAASDTKRITFDANAGTRLLFNPLGTNAAGINAAS